MIMDSEMERIGKESVVAYFRVLYWHLPDKLRNTPVMIACAHFEIRSGLPYECKSNAVTQSEHSRIKIRFPRAKDPSAYGICPSFTNSGYYQGEVCEPGKVFWKDCNICRCSIDGNSSACTKRACPTKPLPAQGDQNTLTCKPGDTFMRDCNTCKCSKDGLSAACTLRGCGPPHLFEKRASGGCEPNKIFKNDCNTCVCSEDGHSAICTLRLCELHSDRKKRASFTVYEGCRPGSSWKNGCNTCYCGYDGYEAFCTLKFCEEEEDTDNTI